MSDMWKSLRKDLWRTHCWLQPSGHRLIKTPRAYVLTRGQGGATDEASSPLTQILIERGSGPKEMKGSNPGN